MMSVEYLSGMQLVLYITVEWNLLGINNNAPNAS